MTTDNKPTPPADAALADALCEEAIVQSKYGGCHAEKLLRQAAAALRAQISDFMCRKRGGV